MSYAWIVVADSSVARIFSAADKRGALSLETKLSCPGAREKNSDLVTDRPGRTFDSHGQGRHANDGDRSPKDQLARQFAITVSDTLKAAFHQGEFTHLHLIADPHFLGLINQELDDSVKKAIAAATAKNLARHSVEDIRSALPELL